MTEEAKAEVRKDTDLDLVKTTVGDLGVRLPIGVGPFDGSQARDTTLAFGDWTGARERELGRLRQANPAATEADLVIMVLSMFVERWGQHEFGKMSDPQKELVLARAASPDIFHAWCQLRVENCGPKFRMTFPCPSCRKDMHLDVDVEDIVEEIPASPTTNLVQSDCKLRKGMMFKGERRFKPLMAPVTWKTFRRLQDQARTDLSETKLTIIEEAIVGFADDDGGEIIVPSTSVDTLNKYDIEYLADYISDRSLGPDLSISEDCPGCGVRVQRPVAWEYDVFFSVQRSGS